MPNWCYNSVSIVGSKNDIDDIMEKYFDSKCISFNKVIPYPEEYRIADEKAKSRQLGEYIKDGYNNGGYEWCLDNWGTKWEAFDGNLDRPKDTELTMGFDTAWSPCEPIFVELSKKYPNIAIRHYFDEPMMCFRGENDYANGEVFELMSEVGDDYPSQYRQDEEEENK